MRITMFQRRFAPMILSGVKRSTIRPAPKRLCDWPRADEMRSLRCWEGAPYRSKQERLRDVLIESVARIRIEEDRDDCPAVFIEGKPADAQEIAISDGFETTPDLRDWFIETHGLPFEGILIRWNPDSEPREGRK